MQLLCELIDLSEQTLLSEELLHIEQDLQDLFEDMGKLKELGLGRMINAFKQTFDERGNKRSNMRPNTNEVGKSLPKWSGLGKDSEVIDVGVIKNWNDVRKAYRKNELAVAMVLYANNKAIALIVADGDKIVRANAIAGVSWDFTNLGLNGEEVQKIMGDLQATPNLSFREKLLGSDSFKSEKTTSKTSNEHWDNKTDKWVEKTVIRHYQGVAQRIKTVSGFIAMLAKHFGTKLTAKVVLVDTVGREKRQERLGNQPIKAENLKLYKDDIKTRLAKFKNSKIENIEDVKDFIAKIFSGAGPGRVKFGGRTYKIAQAESDYKHADSRHRAVKFDDKLGMLFNGKPVELHFGTADPNDYSSLDITVQLKDGQLKPLKMKYYDEDQKRKEMVF